MKMPRFKLCFVVALIGFCIAPYLSNLLPGGGIEAQKWLDKEIAFIEQKIETCEDPEMKQVFEYTVKRYRRIGRFNVRVLQLPDHIHGYNHPSCPGITIDEKVPHMDIMYGALVLVHEAMHDYPPYYFHSHIDNNQIARSLQ